MNIARIRCLAAASFLLCAHLASAAPSFELEYRLDLSEAPTPARVSLTVVQKEGALRSISFDADNPAFVAFRAQDGLNRNGERFVWNVPETGGTLHWEAPITHVRSGEAIDAKLGKRWALFRGEDAFMSVSSRTIKDAESSASLIVELPEDWSFVAPLQYSGDGYVIDDPRRTFDRPTGWMIAGELGVRIDRIAGVRATVAAPKGQSIRRQDMLAMLNWTLPDLVRLLPDYPSEILIVSAEDPFWRGGLSGPASLYLHAQRPLISENGTSTLVHELFHVGFRRSGGKLDDWIVEGLAEYYSVALLRQSGTMTASRFAKTMRSLERWAKKAGDLRGPRSKGATTAKAVVLFAALDAQLRRSGDASLDDVVRTLAQRTDAVSFAELKDVVEELLGEPSDVLARVGE
jgi:hypothetical protein